ncbi:MAG: AmmeMemoRadiSam system radical SAM enzyme [Gemmatimonadota bacterium]
MAGGNGRAITPLISSAGGSSSTLQTALDLRTVRGDLWHVEGPGDVRCVACGHRCLIREGRRGVCKVRFNDAGVLKVPHGYVVALQCDPIEKKPFFHVLPGADALTFGMLGCDFHCGYCQNWLTSQALRDGAAGSTPTPITAAAIVDLASRRGAAAIVSSYNEPLITAEWATEVFRLGRPHGFRTGMVSNGNATPEVLDYIRPWTDAFKIDLKAIDERPYRTLGGTLQHVLDSIRLAFERGFWVEIVTLLVPGFNDGNDALRRMADAIARVSPAIPWHVTAFHQDYRMTEPRNTTADDLMQACEAGRSAGLKFVYAGNLPGRVGRWEHTWCPDCGALLVERFGYSILQQRIGAAGDCPGCGSHIPGIWGREARGRW